MLLSRRNVQCGPGVYLPCVRIRYNYSNISFLGGGGGGERGGFMLCIIEFCFVLFFPIFTQIRRTPSSCSRPDESELPAKLQVLSSIHHAGSIIEPLENNFEIFAFSEGDALLPAFQKYETWIDGDDGIGTVDPGRRFSPRDYGACYRMDFFHFMSKNSSRFPHASSVPPGQIRMLRAFRAIKNILASVSECAGMCNQVFVWILRLLVGSIIEI